MYSSYLGDTRLATATAQVLVAMTTMATTLAVTGALVLLALLLRMLLLSGQLMLMYKASSSMSYLTLHDQAYQA